MIGTPLVIVDGSSYLYRAFYALPMLTTPSGFPTGAIKGVISMLKGISKRYPNSCVIVVFDAKGKTFRDEIYSGYKANRKSMPYEMSMQIELLHTVISAMGFPLFCVEGVEADDVIGTLAVTKFADEPHILISTGDKDMAQLVNHRITLENTMNGSFLDVQGVKEKFGVPPCRIVDHLALMGDLSDNIPGVPGIGPKTSSALLESLEGDLSYIYENLDLIEDSCIRNKRKLSDRLRRYKDMAFMSLKLATIKTDVPLQFKEEEFFPKSPNTEKLIEIYTNLGFKKWKSELTIAESSSPNNNSFGSLNSNIDSNSIYEVVLNKDTLNRWIKKLQSADVIAFAFQTQSLYSYRSQLVGISFSVKEREAVYIPFSSSNSQGVLERRFFFDKLVPIFKDPSKRKVTHDSKFAINVLLNYKVAVDSIFSDTMLQSYLLDPTSTKHDITNIAYKYLGYTVTGNINGKIKKHTNFDQIPLQDATLYGTEYVDIILRLHNTLEKKHLANPKLHRVLLNIEMPLTAVLADIERRGALVDDILLRTYSIALSKKMSQLEHKIFDIAGENFNLNSPKQLSRVLYEKLKLPTANKSVNKQHSTAESVLNDLANKGFILPRLLISYRSVVKLKSTYTDRLPEQINKETQRVHTSYHQAVTATGRLSCSNPNLQNIPVKSIEDLQIRKAFIAPLGYKLLSADYSQIELRIMAHLAKDRGLIDAFHNNLDIHTCTAAEVFGITLKEVTVEQRRSAKAINFGLIYGMGAFGLAKQIGISRTESQDYINKYFTKYPDVLKYMQSTRDQVHKNGYVETIYGRRLYLPQIYSENMNLRRSAERSAINAPMQGTAADIIKKAMISLQRWLKGSNLDAYIILQVHDELVFEVREELVPLLRVKVVEHMTQAANLEVPLVVETGIGNNWYEAH